MTRRQKWDYSRPPQVEDYSKYLGLASMADAPAPTTDWDAILGNKAPHARHANPETQLDWALHWGSKGMMIFPAERFTGEPLIPHWYRDATDKSERLIEWFSQWQTADIAAIPEKSGHYVLAVIADQGGHESLHRLREFHGDPPAEHITRDKWRNTFWWLSGTARTAHHRPYHGLHILGLGARVYLPDSWAPPAIQGG
jgi:hypothetical protein